MPQEEALTALDLRASRLEVLQEGDRPGTIILAPVEVYWKAFWLRNAYGSQNCQLTLTPAWI